MKFGPQKASCFVYTEREGMLSPIGHDLKIEVSDFTVEVAEDGETSATFDASSLRVIGAMHQGELDRDDISEKDRGKIEKNIVKDVLEVKKYPHIGFESTSISRDGESIRVKGKLELHGKTREIEFQLVHQIDEWGAKFSIHQPDFGIKPYKALMGQLRIKADVEVEFVMPEELFERLSIG